MWKQYLQAFINGAAGGNSVEKPVSEPITEASNNPSSQEILTALGGVGTQAAVGAGKGAILGLVGIGAHCLLIFEWEGSMLTIPLVTTAAGAMLEPAYSATKNVVSLMWQNRKGYEQLADTPVEEGQQRDDAQYRPQ